MERARARRNSRSSRLFGGALAALLALSHPATAWSRRFGIESTSCNGCHGGGAEPKVTLSASPENPGVGQVVTLTVTVSQINGPIAGFYLTTVDPIFSTVEPVGTFSAFEPETSADSGGVTHTVPRTGSGGITTFRATWSATAPTGVVFLVNAMSANGDNTPRGDAPGFASLTMAVGCAGNLYYRDQDGDGYGTSDPLFMVRKACAPPTGYAPLAGDCNDVAQSIHPGAPEMCDRKDNNCDGHVDENVVYQPYCEDKDGDGHGIPRGAMKTDCAPSLGFGDCNGDCNDYDALVHPGAQEICDGRDNNCDGAVDEGARAVCGIGWCRRSATDCTTVCTPALPQTEICNLLDDDCDGIIDNGTNTELCGDPQLACLQGRCTPMASGNGGTSGKSDIATDPGTGHPPSGGCTVGPGVCLGSDISNITVLAILIAVIACRPPRSIVSGRIHGSLRRRDERGTRTASR